MDKSEIEQIREHYRYRSDGDALAVDKLLDHIDALDRAIVAHKRDEEQRAEMEKAAFENGRKAALDQDGWNRFDPLHDANQAIAALACLAVAMAPFAD